MIMRTAVLLVLLIASVFATAGVSSSASDKPAIPMRPVHTYSIVARDPETGELGVAVQSHWFSVGSIVTWARAGVGAVATQSIAEPAYGPRLLDRLASGEASGDALAAELAGDSEAAYRQVAVVDVDGRVAAHTGQSCIAEAGDVQGGG